MNLLISVFGIASMIFFFVYLPVSYKRRQAQKEAEWKAAKEAATKAAISKVEAALRAGDINKTHRDELIRVINEDLHSDWWINETIEEFKHEKTLLQKYGEDIGSRLINHKYWIGMTEEQLLDCRGEPDKIEKQVLQTKTKQTYTYGNKSSGDYFVLENGVVVKFVDR